MKILHICTGFPISYQGGITNYVRMLAIEQCKRGLDVTVMGGIDSDVDEYDFNYFPYSSSKIKPFSLSFKRDQFLLDKIKEHLESENYDLIHIHMMLDIDMNLVSILKEKYKYIISLHDYFYLCPRIIMMDKQNSVCSKLNLDKCNTCITKLECNAVFRKFIGKCNLPYPMIKQYKTNERFGFFKELLENAEMLLPVSNRVKEIYVNSGINGNYKVLHIGNYTAIDYKKFDEKLYKPQEKLNVTILGAMTYHKGAEILFSLMKQNKNDNICFNFYGRTNKQYLQEFESLGGKYHGPYSQAQMKSILENSDLGLVLSNWEDNAPQVVMEFLNNNVPVLGTKMGGIPDFVNNDNGFLFDPYSSEDFERAVTFINTIDFESIKLLKKNISRTKTPSEHIEELNELYGSII